MIKYLFAALFLFPSFAMAQESAKAPIVVELFTSQSCSSCPPADKVLGELADNNDHIIALSCNVTYWNHLHWEDTLSQEFCTQRQRGYVNSLESRGPYTPQTVINGKYEMVGSRKNKVLNAIEKVDENEELKNIKISLDKNNVTINLPALPQSQYIVTVLEHGARHTQSIPSGENRGRTVNYTNPVQNLEALGTWGGNESAVNYEIKNSQDAKAIVVLIHDRNPTGPIVAAGKLAF